MHRFFLHSAAMPYAALFASMVTLQVGTAFAKHLFPVVGATGSVTYRVVFSALILLAVWRPWRARWTRADLRIVAAYGITLGAMNLCFYMAIRTIPMGVAISIEFLGPLGLALMQTRRLMHFVWIGLAVLGLGLLLPIGRDAAHLDPAGIAFAGAAGLLWALYIVFGQRAAHIHSGRAVAMGMAFAAVLIAPIGIATTGPELFLPTMLLLGVVVALLSSAIPYTLEMVSLKHMPRRTFGVLLSVEPAIGALAGVIMLSEVLTLAQWIAIGCIVVAAGGAVMARGQNPAAS